MRRTVLALLGACVISIGLGGCFGPTYSPAPLSGGETMTFSLTGPNSKATGTLTFEKNGAGFIVKSSSSSYRPQRVNADLMAGGRPIVAFDLGMVWLPPELREIGKKTPFGDVRETKDVGTRSAFVVWEREGVAKRYFDQKTGFLVYALLSTGLYATSAKLFTSTIDGL